MSRLSLTTATQRAHEGAVIQLHSKDATRTVHQRTRCYLEDGVLVHAHPTRSTGTVSAPDMRVYSVALPGECLWCDSPTRPTEDCCPTHQSEIESRYE